MNRPLSPHSIVTEMNELLPYALAFPVFGGLSAAWLVVRWTRKSLIVRRRTLAFERSIEETVAQLRLRMGERL
jgi:hypothetical protein